METQKLGRLDEGKMIKLSVHFHTDKILNNENKKIAQMNGKVFAMANRQRGIRPTKPENFNNLRELPKAITNTLNKAGIIIVDKNFTILELNEKLICGNKNEAKN